MSPLHITPQADGNPPAQLKLKFKNLNNKQGFSQKIYNLVEFYKENDLIEINSIDYDETLKTYITKPKKIVVGKDFAFAGYYNKRGNHKIDFKFS
jgi:hypothetical protein